MKTITLHNEKGGVTKTTLAVHLASALAIQGQRVVLVDTDPQGHAAYLLGLPKTPAIYDLLVRDAEWSDVLQEAPAEHYCPAHALDTHAKRGGALYVCAANAEAVSIPNHVQDPLLLRERIDELDVDAVIVDTSPTPSMTNALVFYASDALILPSTAEQLGLDGLASTVASMTRISATRKRDTGNGLHLLGVQTSMYDARTAEHKAGYATIQQQFGAYAWEPIPLRTAVREASAVGKTVYAYDPGCDAAKAMWAFVDRVTKGVQHGA